METILASCAGLDVHKESVEACVRRIEPDGRVHSETRRWGTMTRDLLAMADWLSTIKILGGGTIFLSIAAWLIKTIITHQLDRDNQSFRENLRHDSQADLSHSETN